MYCYCSRIHSWCLVQITACDLMWPCHVNGDSTSLCVESKYGAFWSVIPYAEGGQWDDAAKVRMATKNKRVKKKLG
eukprot:c44453_g1_i1 orf=107-334(-)